MTSKNLFFKLMKEDLKRRVWAVALLSLGFFFFYPVVAAFTAGNIKDYMDYAKGLAEYEKNLVRWLSFNSGMTVFLMMAAALICGLSSFSFLNSKSKVDFYHGIPVRREMLFVANFSNGILMLAVPYGICQLLAVLVGVSNGASFGRIFQVALAAYGLHITYFILMYSTVVVAAMLTGHLVVGFLGTMVLAFYMPMATGLLVAYLSSFFRTYSSRLPGLLSERVLMHGIRISPIAEYIYQLSRNGEQYQVPVPMAGAVLIAWGVSFFLAALSCFLYRKRPSEAAGKAMAFSVTCPVIRILLTMLSALGLGLFFYMMRSSMGWAVFGILFGGGICHCVVEIIYHFDFKKLFSHKLQLVCCLVASLLIMVVFRYDLLGYDRYLPKAGQVREAAVHVDRTSDWVSYGHTQSFPDGHYEWNYESYDGYMFQNMKYHDIENLLAIASAGIEQTERRKDQTVYRDRYYGEEYPEDGTIWSEVEVCYTLNSGRMVCRIYHMPIDGKAWPAMKKMHEDSEFQKGTYPLMTMTSEQVDSIRFRGKYSKGDYGENEVCLEKLSAKEKEKLLKAYQQEFMAMKVEELEKEAPVGLIRFGKEIDEEAIRWWKQQDANEYKDYPSYRYRGWRDLVNKDYYPVYPSFAETIRLLKEQGAEVGGYLDELDVRAVQVRAPQMDEDEYYEDEYYEPKYYDREYNGSSEYLYIRDPEKIEELKNIWVYDELCYYDPFFRAEDAEVSLMILDLEKEDDREYDYEEYEDGSWNTRVRVVFPEGRIPDFVWESEEE